MPLKHGVMAFFLSAAVLSLALASVEGQIWKLALSVLEPGPAGSFDETAVKDPSVVYANGRWHVFYTARGNRQYSLGYAAGRRLEDLRSARRFQLPSPQVARLTIAAPQVFFFRPQKKWYLVYQTSESNYQPVFATTSTIEDPASWSAPRPLVKKSDAGKWIDFWVICDEVRAYLFYTRDHNQVVAMTTTLQDFPAGFGNPQTVFRGVHEAVHVYRESGPREKYAMLYELQDAEGWRRIALAEAEHLAGPWRLTDAAFADAAHLTKQSKLSTRDISHGELLRTGNDERLEANVKRARFLIQAMPANEHKGEYPELPWRLSLIQNF